MEILEGIKHLTKDNGAIKDLRDLMVLTAFTDENLEQFFTLKQNVEQGKKLGWVGEMSEIGWKGAPCYPEYRTPTISSAEKQWDLGDWSVPLKWCYEEFMGTLAEYALKTGTDIHDLTGTDIMDVLILPALEEAYRRMAWRFIWFNDKNKTAENITPGMEVELFNTNDGLFKQLFAIGAANPAQRITIEANQEATIAAQMNAIKQPGVAVNLFDSLLDSADPRIASLDGAGLYVTKSLADALTKDLKREYKEIITWDQVFNGIKVTEYNGVKIYAISLWDRMIQRYENNGTSLNLPHRAVFGTPKQMFVGTPANNIISDFDLWFNKDERVVKHYSAGRLGTLIGEDNLFQLAY